MEFGSVLPAGLPIGARGGLTAVDPLAHLRARFQGRRDGPRAGGDRDDLPGPWKPAAVLVPIVLRENEPTLLLTQRTQHLTYHPGQISFPGGRIEADDPDPEAAALREAREEIGLDPAHVEVLGRLDRYRTVTLYEVIPVVALVRPPFDLTLDAHEVADAFEVPLPFLLDPTNHQRHSHVTPTGPRSYWAMPWRDRFIWGATAGMLVNLVTLLSDAAGRRD